MDQYIDVKFRPATHDLLDFLYLTNPKSGKPLLDSRGVYMALANLEIACIMIGREHEAIYEKLTKKNYDELVATFPHLSGQESIPFEERETK